MRFIKTPFEGSILLKRFGNNESLFYGGEGKEISQFGASYILSSIARVFKLVVAPRKIAATLSTPLIA